MKKDVVKKIEEEIKQKTTLPDDIKGKIRKEVFINILIAIGLVIYFTFLILGSVGTVKNVRSTDFNIFSIIILGVTIYLFEISYKKDNGKLAMFGVETLVTAIFTLFLPYVIFELDKTRKIYYLIIAGYIGLYYIIKCIYVSLRIKKKYITELSDIKDIIKKEKRKASEIENIQTVEETAEIISGSEVNKQKNDEKEIKKDNTAKDVKTKTKSTTKKTANSKEKNIAIKESASKKKTSKTEANTETTNTPKKRGRPKKSETLKKEIENKLEEAPKKRGRPKKEETLKKETDNQLENAPKKRGRPRKVVTSND